MFSWKKQLEKMIGHSHWQNSSQCIKYKHTTCESGSQWSRDYSKYFGKISLLLYIVLFLYSALYTFESKISAWKDLWSGLAHLFLYGLRTYQLISSYCKWSWWFECWIWHWWTFRGKWGHCQKRFEGERKETKAECTEQTWNWEIWRYKIRERE